MIKFEGNDWRTVLRRPPRGDLPPSAFDVRREYRVMRALRDHDSAVPTPQPILPNMKKLKFLDIDATEFARQLTIIESKLYDKIKPTECINKSWQRKVEANEPDPAANIKALVLHSNQLTNWVAQMILNQADVRRRVTVIKHFVSVADVSISA